MEDKFAVVRRQYLMVLSLCIIVMALMEVALFACVDLPKKGVTWNDFNLSNLFVPLGINLVIFLVLVILVANQNLKPTAKNYACSVAFVLVCSVIVTTHYDYPALLAAFVIPVIWSVVFEDKLLCSITHFLCQIGILQLTVSTPMLSEKNTIETPASDLAKQLTEYFSQPRKNNTITAEDLMQMSEKTRISGLWLNIILGIIMVALARLFAYLMLVQLKKKDRILQTHEKDNMALEKQLLRDQMTGLYNHTAFYEFLDRCVKMKGDAPLTLAVVDIDDFKKVNDTYGHDNGDEVILTLSKILQDHCGNDNYVCRYGGEEFAVIFPNSREKDARQVMLSCLEAFRNTHYDWHSGNISFSCGVFQCSPYRMNAEEFFQITDKLLYKAKHNGKNQVCGGQ